MHNLLCFSTLIFASLLSTVYSDGPGSVGCVYYGNVYVICNTSCRVPVSNLPNECTSFFYESLTVDMRYAITYLYNGNNKNDVIDLVQSNMPVILYYGRITREDWTHVLGCGQSCADNAADEMESLKAYFDQYGKIAGLVIYGLEPNENTKDCPKFSTNLGVYLRVMKETFPKLIIGINIRAINIIQYNGKPHNLEWLTITDIDDFVDFYVLSYSELNTCTDDLKCGGIFPESGSAPNTMESVQCIIKEMNIKPNKLLFRYNLNAIDKDSSLPLTCLQLYSEICRKGEGTSDLCADTQATFKLKGEFAKNNGNGFIVRFIDLDDTTGCDCKCNTPYPAFQAILDGYNNANTENNCCLFNRD